MEYLLIAMAVAAVAWFLVTRRGPDPIRLAEAAAESEDLAGLLDAARKLPYKQRSRFFQEAINWLWNNWQRPLAARLAREFAEQHGAEKIAQFWLRQVMEVEPREAQRNFDKRFLESYYRPEVAKQCGLTKS